MKTQIKDIVIGIFAVIGFTAVVMGFTNQLPEQVNIDGNLIVDGNISSTVFENSYGSDAAAASAGVPVYGVYRNGSFIVVRLN